MTSNLVIRVSILLYISLLLKLKIDAEKDMLRISNFGGPQQLCSGLTLSSAQRDYSWQVLGNLWGAGD